MPFLYVFCLHRMRKGLPILFVFTFPCTAIWVDFPCPIFNHGGGSSRDSRKSNRSAGKRHPCTCLYCPSCVSLALSMTVACRRCAVNVPCAFLILHLHWHRSICLLSIYNIYEVRLLLVCQSSAQGASPYKTHKSSSVSQKD